MDCEGISDPAVACLGIDVGATKIYVHRDEGWLAAYESFIGCKMPEMEVDKWRECVSVYSSSALKFRYTDLDRNSVVGEILEACSIKPVDHLIDAFQQFKVEQHLPKARLRWDYN